MFSRLLKILALLGLVSGLLQGFPALANSAEELERQLEEVINEDGRSSRRAFRLRKELTEEYDANNQFAKTIPHYKIMLERIGNKKGTDHPKYAKFSFNLGKNLRMIGRSTEAIEYLQAAIDIWGDKFGENDSKTLKAKYNLARAYENAGQLPRAIPLMEYVIRESDTSSNKQQTHQYVRQVWLAKMYMKAGRTREAEKLLTDSRDGLLNDYDRAGPGSKALTQVYYQMARFELLRGNYSGAERILQKAYGEATNKLSKEHPLMQGIMGALAGVYTDQGRYTEAEKLQFQVYEKRKEFLGLDSIKTIFAANQLAIIYIGLERIDKAEPLLRQSLSKLEEYGNQYRSSKSDTMVQLARIEVMRGKLDEAEALLIQALEIPHTATSTRPIVAHQELGDIYIRQKQYDKALDHLQQGLSTAITARGEKHRHTGNLHALLGKAYHGAGNLKDAVAHYRKAIGILTALAATGSTESAGGLVQQEKLVHNALQGYMNLLITASQGKQNLGFDPSQEAFAMAETARGRSVQKALLGMGARAAAGNTELSEQVRKEQDKRMQVGLLEDEIIQLLGEKDADQQRDKLDDLNDKRADLTEEIQELTEKIYQQFPAYARLMNPQPATIASVQNLLNNDEVMLSYLVEDDRTLLWAIDKQGSTLHEIPLGRGKLNGKIKRLRKGLDVSATSLSDIPPYDTRLAHELYRNLVAPAEQQLAGAKHVIVVPNGPLLSLPFGALVSSNAKPGFGGIPFSGYKKLPWLATRYAISVVPTATVLVTLRSVSHIANAQKPFVGFGNPVFNPAVAGSATQNKSEVMQRAAVSAEEIQQLPPLPETEQELIKIARTLGADAKSDLYLKMRADEVQVRSANLRDYNVVAFATHGLLSGELKGLDEPALALTPPKKSSNDENDGLLKMSEVLSLKLNASWVVLSACNTASADGKLDSDGLSGLARAFFYAGSRAMLVTLWPVETTSAQLMTTSLFEATRANKYTQRATALAAARKRLIEGPGHMNNGKEVFSYAHPMFWAAFIVVGEGGV